jgi:hypothetical protein
LPGLASNLDLPDHSLPSSKCYSYDYRHEQLAPGDLFVFLVIVLSIFFPVLALGITFYHLYFVWSL